MKILGLDIATKTGYCLLENGDLKNYGMIDIPSEMNLFQRISFFENSLNKILNDFNPDCVAIEDVLLGISGAKTLAYLSRLNGIALSCCYKKVQNNIHLYMPSEWKSKSLPGLNGSAKKFEIQIAVCKQYHLIDDNLLSQITKPLDNVHDESSKYEQSIKTLSEDIKKYIAFLNRKRNGLKNDFERKAFENKIKQNKNELDTLKQKVKDCKDKIEEIYKNVSLEIMSKCGLTCDVSDSIGIAYCFFLENLSAMRAKSGLEL